MNKLMVLCYLFTIFCTTINSARILGILHVPMRSHYYVGETLLKGLANKGHNVTIVSYFQSKDNSSNCREIFLDGVHKIIDDYRKFHIDIPDMAMLSTIIGLNKMMYSLGEITLRSQAIQKLIKTNETFDALMVEPFVNEAFFGLAHIFNSHIVIIDTANSIWINHYTGNVAPHSFVPNILTPFSDKMNFKERVLNSVVSIILSIYINFFAWPLQEKLYKELFKDVPPFEETLKNVSLVFVNTHVVFETPRPYLPNMIPIGGIHVKEPTQLPKDLQTYMDSATDGVIFFSLGSNLKSSHLSTEKQQQLRAFSKLPHNILWKFENEYLPNKPENVKICKWVPQSDVLAHPNIKLFITHGGLLSTIETIYRGVPILGIPIYGDQYGNIANLVLFGYGQSISLNHLNEESFTEVLKEVLDNPSYRHNVKKYMAILRDQPDRPLDRAIFWVEHIIRHNGARHLRSASVDIPFYQYLLMDVFCVIAAICIVFVILLYIIIRKLCYCFKKFYESAVNIKSIKPKKD